jgi:hypothetical protein
MSMCEGYFFTSSFLKIPQKINIQVMIHLEIYEAKMSINSAITKEFLKNFPQSIAFKEN